MRHERFDACIADLDWNKAPRWYRLLIALSAQMMPLLTELESFF